MQCRACGTEIADKAIVCFRCGAPTLDAPASPAPAASREGRARARAWIVAGVVMAAGTIAGVMAFDDPGLRAAGAAAAAACAGLSWRLLAGRGALKRASGVD
jgi:hypothetical protein